MAEEARVFFLRKRRERAEDTERRALLEGLGQTRSLIAQAYAGFNAANSKIRINPPTIQGRALSKVSTAIPSQLSSARPLAAGSPRSYPGCACASPSSSLTRRSR